MGVLVAISIPIFTAQLEKARDATSVANLRSAYAEASALMLSEPDSTDAEAGNAAKTAANVVVVSNVTIPCSDGNFDQSELPFTATGTLSNVKKGTVTFTFGTDGTITSAVVAAGA